MNRWIINTLGVLVFVLAGIYVYISVTSDRTAPKITIPNTSVTYEEGEAKDVLLEGVTAIDDVDGDVTDSLTIASLYPILNNTQARVVYIARDKSNNIVKKERIVDYVKKTEQSDAVSENSGETDENTQGAAANNDQPLSPEEKLAEAQAAAEASFAELAPEAPRLTLSALTVNITAGQEFLIMQYIYDITDDKDKKEDLFKRVQVSGTVNINRAGTYQLTYVAVDSDGNHSNKAVLTVNVIQ